MPLFHKPYSMKLSASALLTTFLDNEIFQSAVVIGTNALHQFSHCQERAFGFSWACVGDTPTSRAVAGGNALKGEHSVILTLSVAAVDDAQTPDRRSRYTWHSAGPTSGCCCSHTTRHPNA